MSFGIYSNSVPTNLEIYINDMQIVKVDSTQYLGVIVDFKMN